MTEQLKTFNTYEEYLDSHLVEEDLYYLKVATSNTAQYSSSCLSKGRGICPSDPDARLQVRGQGLWSRGFLQRENVGWIITLKFLYVDIF